MNRITFALLGILAFCPKLLLADQAPPNVIVIFIDDMGYADIGPFGAKGYSTPHLDRMASEGRKFTNFVVSSAVCSASRAALLTGCYHTRVGITGALMPDSEIGLNDQETTLAELCKSKGYATAAFGKWHLGHHPKFLPTHHGFDQFYGIPYSNDMWPQNPSAVTKRAANPDGKSRWPSLPMIAADPKKGVRIVNDHITAADQAVMTRDFTSRAVSFIKDHPIDPFFLYLPHPMVHVPLYASEDFRGKSGAGIFGDVVMEIDWSVGQILSAVEDIGAERNTLVIFTSDNGPWLSYGDHGGSASPLREGKGTMFEGGYREPTLMWWKGKIPAGTTCDQLCSSIDIVPTVAQLIGTQLIGTQRPITSDQDQALAANHKIDGKDIAPLMFRDDKAPSPHDHFYCYYGGGELQAVRNQRFKLVFPHRYRTLNGHPGGTQGLRIPYQKGIAELALYDLDKDVSETTNVMKDHPEVVKSLQLAAEAARQDLGDKLTGRTGTGNRPPGRMEPDDQRLPQNWR